MKSDSTDFILYVTSGKGKTMVTEIKSGADGSRGLMTKEHERIFEGGMEILYVLIVVIVRWLYTYKIKIATQKKNVNLEWN